MDDGKKLLLIGGGGHCRSVLDSVFSRGLYKQESALFLEEIASDFTLTGVPLLVNWKRNIDCTFWK